MSSSHLKDKGFCTTVVFFHMGRNICSTKLLSKVVEGTNVTRGLCVEQLFPDQLKSKMVYYVLG